MKKAITLLELLISIVLLSIIVFGFANIDFFSNAQVNLASRRAKLQNEVSFALSHMAKNVSRAIGNEMANGNNSVINIASLGGNPAVRIFIDSTASGGPGDGSVSSTPPDRWIAYRFTGSAGYQIWFCPQCTNSTCDNCIPAWGSDVNNIVSRRITNFLRIKPPGIPGSPLSDNFISVEITACWDPATAESVDNPCVTMSSSIKMPSVSVN